MYKILHIPTAQLVCDFKEDLIHYIKSNRLNYDDITRLYHEYDKLVSPLLFKTKQLALDYINSFSYYTKVCDGLILWRSLDEDAIPLNKHHLDIIEVKDV